MKNIPLYKIVYDDLREKIETGIYEENMALPSERALCQIYHVSRSTLRSALEELCRNDYIVKSQGNGNFVKPKMFERKLTRFNSFADSLNEQHIAMKNQIINYEIITSDKYLDSLNLSKPNFTDNTRWHKLTRIRSVDDDPILIETSYMAQWRFYEFDTSILSDASLYAYLRKNYNMVITDANELLSPVLPNKYERSLLNISKHIPCMLDELFCYEKGNLISIHHTVVRGDKFKFQSSAYING